MTELLFAKAIHHVQDAPPDAYLLYNLRGSIGYVNRKEYAPFLQSWIGTVHKPAWTMDLASAQHHALILDLDFEQETPLTTLSPLIRDLIHSTLTCLFFPHVSNFTYILAMRHKKAGLHVHLPEFTISHDDYILLCQHLQLKLQCTIVGKGRYHLDIISNAMLYGASKPDTHPYQAVYVIYVDERETHTIDLTRDPVIQMRTKQQQFKRRANNANSIFRKMLFLPPLQYQQYIDEYMMPVIVRPLHRLSYATFVAHIPIEDGVDVATFTFKRNQKMGYISKGETLLFNQLQFLKAYQYMRSNAFTLDHFETSNHALKVWYARHQATSSSLHSIFDPLNHALREDNVMFEKQPNPIQVILQYNKGYYFIPVFYALCKHLNMTASEMAQHILGFIHKDYHPLLHRIEQINTNHVDAIRSDLSVATIYFCGNNLYKKPAMMRDKLKRVVQDSRRAIMCLTTQEDFVELLRRIQEHHFPICVLSLCNALKKASRYYWNYLSESWQEVGHNNEINDLLGHLWEVMKAYINEQKMANPDVGGPEDSDKTFNLEAVVRAIRCDSAIESKRIQMDRHKWFIRLLDGTLDLLTGHIGATVPELFLSDRKLGIDMSRETLTTLLSPTDPHRSLYELLMRKEFFLSYLKELFLDKTDQLFHTLQEMLYHQLPGIDMDECTVSMLHFYTNMCKYMSFEHDMLMYMMDVLASIFIATNYERKFFVFKGVTGNGKSKLFELLGKVFGGYYHNIQSDNLKPNSGSGNATPELASTLFSCRIVTLEELESKINENRVKQITGNSQVAFRNMYEANVGGIPTAKIFSTTNKLPECQATQAFVERVIALPFHATFVETAPETTGEQVRLNLYNKDSYVVENSYKGCFLMLYYHLEKHMQMKDGLLHYRKTPDSVEEYTKDFLINTDIYTQFKKHMDVQLNADGLTTMNDLKSAIRQFFKSTKNNSNHETELVIKFEDEFGKYRQSDIQLNTTRYTSPLETLQPLQLENSQLLEDEEEGNPVQVPSNDEPPPRKKAKKTQASVVFYTQGDMTTCKWYDLEKLKMVPQKVDRLIEYARQGQKTLLSTLGRPNPILKGFNDITPKLIEKFQQEAYAHVEHVLKNLDKYGYLYHLAAQNCSLVNSVYFDYENFPFMQEKIRVLDQIRRMAVRFSQPNTNHFDVTCIYLLYFYTLLINSHTNWVTIDYLAGGNRYHQYLTYTDITPQPSKNLPVRDKSGKILN